MRVGDRKDQEWLAETSVLVLSATNQVRKILGESLYDAYFKRMELESFDGSSVRLSVATKFQRKYIADNYINILTEIWRNLANDSSVQAEIEVRGTTIAKPAESAQKSLLDVIKDDPNCQYDKECISEHIELTAEESELQSISLEDKFWKESSGRKLTDIVHSVNPINKIELRRKDSVGIRDIQKLVCQRYGIGLNYFIGSRVKFRQVTWPRHMSMYLCCEYTRSTYSDIGRMFGGMDHSTVFYAHNKVGKMIEEGDNWFAEEIGYFENELSFLKDR